MSIRLQSEPILIVHSTPREPADGRPVWKESDAGVLDEVNAVRDALAKLGIPCRVEPAARFTHLPRILITSPERIVFNLVEDFPDHAASACYCPALCRAYGKEATGSSTPSLLLSQDKWRSKILFKAAGLNCPEGIVIPIGKKVHDHSIPEGPLMVKPPSSDASEGIDACSVIRPGDSAALDKAVRKIHEHFAQPALVEQFIGRREINVALLQKGSEVRVLAIAEIDFEKLGPDRPPIVDYAAKWLPESFEYQNTPRVIPARLTQKQSEEVERHALAAWSALDCSDYARVDFRLDEKGRPVALEVNTNPDIAPQGGFCAALQSAGVPYEEFVHAVLDNALQRLGVHLPAAATPPPPPGPRRSKIVMRFAEQRDREPVLSFLAATGFFRPDELAVAEEVVDSAVAKGPTGHYQSYVSEENGQAVAWVCFGPTPCTLSTFDIYWLAVAPSCQRAGVGKSLLQHAERLIKERGGALSVVETAGRASYDSTRRFYEKCGYQVSARVKDFYAPGDDKIIYTKPL